MEQNKELRQAWDFVEHTGTSIFLTGKAGTGKTTFLKAVKERSLKRMIVVAPTGVAAINAGGVTIHSFFQLPLSPYIPGASFRDRFDFGREKRRIIRTLDMLVIDEVSMVRSDLLDAIDFVLRRYRDHSKPFGGLQLLMIGDLQQLTPVVTPQDEEMLRGHYDTPYFFGSRALQQVSYVTILLTRVFRQQDRAFIDILNHVRDGRPTAEDIENLNRRYRPAFVPKPGEGYIRLTTHNRLADSYNERELGKLPGQCFSYTAEVEGTFPEYSYPADVRLELKPGAQVMFLKNDVSGARRYYNGRIGHVSRIDGETIEVECAGDREPIVVERQEWENTRYVINEHTKVIEPQVQGVFRQYPLRLAWAITIHKSQGLTFERAIIDAGLSFASGQVYVALSRCKSLEGLVLASPIGMGSIINDHRVADYIARQEVAAAQSVRELPNLKEEYYRFQLLDLFDFSALYGAEQAVHRTLLEYFHDARPLTALHGQLLVHLKERLVDVSHRWQRLIRGMPSEQLHGAEFLDRVKRGAGYFIDVIETELKRAIDLTRKAETGNKRGAELMEERYRELWLQYLAKNRLLRGMEEVTFDVPAYMQVKQEALLDAMDVVSPDSRTARSGRRKRMDEPEKLGQHAAPSKKPRRVRGETYDKTYGMLLSGMSPEAIASERGLTPATVYGHLARFVKSGKLRADRVIDASKVKAIRHAIARLPEEATMSEIKAACRDDITWTDIRFILSSR